MCVVQIARGLIMNDYNMQVRMPKSEITTYKDAAKLSGVSVSSWVRDRLRKAARQELQSSGMKVSFLEDSENG